MEREEELKKIQKDMSEFLNLNSIADILKNNEVEFQYKDNTYRIKKPTLQQKQETYQKKVEKFTKLLDEVDENGQLKYKLEEDLKKSYLKRNIDIDSMDRKMYNLNLKRDELMLKLGESLKKNASDEECNILKKEIESLVYEIQNLSIKKTQLLETSIENQCLIYFYTYLTYLITEKKVLGKDLGEGKKEENYWVKVWNSWNEFQNADEGLLNKASYYTTLICGSEIEE